MNSFDKKEWLESVGMVTYHYSSKINGNNTVEVEFTTLCNHEFNSIRDTFEEATDEVFSMVKKCLWDSCRLIDEDE